MTIGPDTLVTYSNLDRARGYTTHTFDVSRCAGQRLTLSFVGTENAARKTSFDLDDTSLMLS